MMLKVPGVIMVEGTTSRPQYDTGNYLSLLRSYSAEHQRTQGLVGHFHGNNLHPARTPPLARDH